VKHARQLGIYDAHPDEAGDERRVFERGYVWLHHKYHAAMDFGDEMNKHYGQSRVLLKSTAELLHLHVELLADEEKGNIATEETEARLNAGPPHAWQAYI
jgi:hypothetical protein